MLQASWAQESENSPSNSHRPGAGLRIDFLFLSHRSQPEIPGSGLEPDSAIADSTSLVLESSRRTSPVGSCMADLEHHSAIFLNTSCFLQLNLGLPNQIRKPKTIPKLAPCASFETENPNRHGKQPWSLGWVSHFSWKKPLPSALSELARHSSNWGTVQGLMRHKALVSDHFSSSSEDSVVTR